MSHFIVVVIGDNVDEQLAPYDESIEVAPYSNGVVSEDDKTHFVNFCAKEHPEDINLSFDDLYGKYGVNWNNNRWKKNSDGEYEEFSTYNPDSKWDWYSVGGRWSGYFKKKPETDGILGEPGVFNNKPKPDTADVIKKKDVDFEAMMDEYGETATKKYDAVFEAIKDTPKNESWESIRSRIENIDVARNTYRNQPRVMAFDNLTRTSDMFGMFEDVEDFEVDREIFIQNARNRAISPFAVVKDGVWYQKGEMGWWGMSTDEMTQEEWNKKVVELFDSVPDDTVFTAIDCHI